MKNDPEPLIESQNTSNYTDLYALRQYKIRWWIDEKDKWVEITHTLTSAFCPFADEIVASIQTAGYVEEVLSVEIVTTFDPPFTMDSVSDETKMIMGWDYSL